MRAYFCGVPTHHCTGSDAVLSSHLRKEQPKIHHSTESAFKCHAKWLLSQGYERRGSREFAEPNGGYIVVLTKKSRFGGVLRAGKRVTGTKSKRFVPAGKFTGGLIASY